MGAVEPPQHGQSASPGMRALFAPAQDVKAILPGFVKTAPVAWYASHHHDGAGANVPYDFAYLFAHRIHVPKGARTITLPKDDHIQVLAISTSDEAEDVTPVERLYGVRTVATTELDGSR
jgi:alpha-mannosidase